MGRKNRKFLGYKPVECQEIAEPEYNHIQDNPKEIVNIPGNYTLAGNCRKTKTGNSLGLDIVVNGEHHYYTILKVHIDALFDETLPVAHIREYPPLTNTTINNQKEED